MKKVSNKVAVATLLSTMPSTNYVRILDVDRYLWSDSNLFEAEGTSFGIVYSVDSILHNVDNVRIARAQILRTAVNEGIPLLVIDTLREEY